MFDAIVQSARRLLSGHSAALTRIVGDALHLAAGSATTPIGDAAIRALHPTALASSSATHARAIRAGAPVIVEDMETDPHVDVSVRDLARARGFRSVLAVPMLRQGNAIGALNVTRPVPGAFSDDEVALLQTFADQAVIAIENVRLFRELQERNRDLTATGEILRVIASSPTDVQPVFDTIVRNVVSLSGAMNGSLYRFDGDLIHYAAEFDRIHFSAGFESWGRSWDEWRNSFPAAVEPRRRLPARHRNG